MSLFNPVNSTSLPGLSITITIADNARIGGSIEIATEVRRARDLVAQKDYGSVLMGGIAAARGRVILMGDADASYDFLETLKLVEKLREGSARLFTSPNARHFAAHVLG